MQQLSLGNSFAVVFLHGCVVRLCLLPLRFPLEGEVERALQMPGGSASPLALQPSPPSTICSLNVSNSSLQVAFGAQVLQTKHRHHIQYTLLNHPRKGLLHILLWGSQCPTWLCLWVRKGIVSQRAEHRWDTLLQFSIASVRAVGGGKCVGESVSSAEQPWALQSTRFILPVGTLGDGRGKFHF